jgi:hypothetical protein
MRPGRGEGLGRCRIQGRTEKGSNIVHYIKDDRGKSWGMLLRNMNIPPLPS